MGADLYLKTKKGEEIRHFRDCYNPSSVLWKLDLSWWRDISNEKNDLKKLNIIKEKIDLFNKNGFIKEYIEYSNKTQDKLTATKKDVKELETFVNTAIDKIKNEKCYIEWSL